MRKIGLLIISTILLCSCNSGVIYLTQAGKSDYRIVVAAQADSITYRAAYELQRYVKVISGAELVIVSDTEEPQDEEIIIGQTNRSTESKPLSQDGVRIQVVDDRLLIEGGAEKGVLYAVYTLLDEKFGVRLYAIDAEVIPSNPSMTLEKNTIIEHQPVITFRDTHYKATNDAHYIDWHRLSHDADGQKPEWGLWVHTFLRLVPPAEYWKTHPEYYALRDGKRALTQLCLSNPAVLEILCGNLQKEIGKNPTAKYWSVSSDDNFGYCQCDECRKADELDGSATGSVIQFVNKVAARFPDKIISTLAYQYSRAAPKVTIPAKNVNIMFCNIECNRSQPIATDPSSESFRNDMVQWARLTDNILVWDYVIQFKNLVSPFPNFHTLQPNIQFFVDNSVVALFEQGNREVGGEFAEMRSYIINKLLWNPQASTDSLMTDFCKGYYGDGGTYIKQYVEMMASNLADSGDNLSIFGSPCDASQSYLSPDKMEMYQALFESAEKAVSSDATLLKRVQIARQPLYYTELEMAKLDPYSPKTGIFERNADGRWVSRPEYTAKLEQFIALCKEQGVTRLSEWHTTPDDYLRLMSDIAIVRQDGNLSFEKEAVLNPKPAERYSKGADKVLTNGIFGSNDYMVQWLGWETIPFEITVDLGSKQEIKSIETHFLQELTAYILLPKSVEYQVSENGTAFSRVGIVKYDEDKTPLITKSFELKTQSKGRYIKAKVIPTGMCPPWHIGAGSPAWTFCDEIIVR